MGRRKLPAILLASAALALALGYVIFWYMLAWQIEEGIASRFADAFDQGIHIEGDLPEITGFPGKHHISFSGSFLGDGWHVTVPLLIIRGFILPGQLVEVELPEGLTIAANSVPAELGILNYAYLETIVPQDIPADLTVEALRSWREASGKLEISRYEIRNEPLTLIGAGEFRLDNDLQPEGRMEVKAYGHMAFLGRLQKAGLIEKRQALITGSVLNSLTAQDSVNGKRFLNAAIQIQNRRLLIGPLQLVKLPRVEWPYARFN